MRGGGDAVRVNPRLRFTLSRNTLRDDILARLVSFQKWAKLPTFQEFIMSAFSVRRARHIARTLGVYCAARYLCKRGVSLEGARWVLLGI
jgi:hypothetical protein